jgi:hypothetical protein
VILNIWLLAGNQYDSKEYKSAAEVPLSSHDKLGNVQIPSVLNRSLPFI